MSQDPITDLAAAEAFTKQNAYTQDRISSRVLINQTWTGSNFGKPICRASVHNGSGCVGFHQCTAKAKTQTADGVWWCGVHEPKAVERRAAAVSARHAAIVAKHDKVARIRADTARMIYNFPSLLAALRKIEAGDNDPRTTAREALGTYLEDKG